MSFISADLSFLVSSRHHLVSVLIIILIILLPTQYLVLFHFVILFVVVLVYVRFPGHPLETHGLVDVVDPWYLLLVLRLAAHLQVCPEALAGV